jgi:O-antigen biosynthesis protein
VIGSEGMMLNQEKSSCTIEANDLSWPGVIQNQSKLFVQETLQLYDNKNIWLEKQKIGFDLVSALFNEEKYAELFCKTVEEVIGTLKQRRETDFVQQLLWHQTNRSTEYFSKWIELKNQHSEKMKK